MAIRERIVTDDGVHLGVGVHGEGPPLLMIPGLGATRHIYAPIVEGLAAAHRVILFDPRGVGESDVPAGPYPMARLAADVVQVAAAFEVEHFHLFGASMGGLVAEHVAVLHGPRIHKLVLAATGAGGKDTAAASPEVTAALLGRGARTPEAAYRIASTVLYSQRFQREHADFIEAEVSRRGAHPIDPRGFAAQFAASRSADISDRLAEILVPTLVMHGTEDRLVPLENAGVLARSIPGAREQIFQGAGHLFFHEDPERTVAVMLSFLR